LPENSIETYEFNAEKINISIFTGQIILDFYNFDVNNFLLHTHQWYEIFYVMEGDMIFHFEDDMFNISEGEVIIVEPDVLHYVSRVQKDAKYFALNFFVDTSQNKDSDIHRFFDFSKYVVVEADEESSSVAKMIKTAMEKRKGRLAGIYLFALLTKLADLYGNKIENIKTIGTDSNMSRIYAVESLIGKYFNTNITIDAVAAQLHISKRQLLRIIKKHYGCTYKERIIKLRMEEAKRLLQNGEYVDEVASKCGYDSVSAFYSAFKKSVGVLPGKYKTQL